MEHLLAWRFGNEQLTLTLSGRLFDRTRGQPLFLISLLDHLVDQHAIVEKGGTWQLACEASISQDVMPNDLNNFISHQIDHLSAGERQLLEAASVAGGEFAAALLAAGLGRDVLEVEQALDGLARRDHTLSPSGVEEWPDGSYSGTYTFHHILYQDVLYRRLTPGGASNFIIAWAPDWRKLTRDEPLISRIF